MKKRTVRWMTLLLVTVLLCNALPVSYAEPIPTVINEENLLPNGGFEAGHADDWERTAAVEVITDAAKDGEYGVKATSRGVQWAEYDGLFGDFDVEPHTDYVFSFDHKSDITSCVIVYIKDEARGKNIVQDWPAQVSGCWSKQEYHFNSSDCDRIRIQLCVGAKNSVRLFDNVRLRRPVENIFGGGLGSVSEIDENRQGLAFRFDVAASVQVEQPFTYLSGTVDPYGAAAACPILRMGALVTNRPIPTEELTLAAVDGKTCIDIAADRVRKESDSRASFAVRIANVPLWANDVTITARPYVMYKDGDEQRILYASAYSESCDSIAEREATAVFDAGEEWELIWNDEFGGTAVDETKWYGELLGGSGDVYITNRKENLSVKDGSMVLTALAEPINNARFTGSRVNTGHNFSFLYGRLEFRAKLPWGKGISPALWTLGDYFLYNNVGNGWPYGGEIDIMELVGESNTNPKAAGDRTTSHNIHWGYDRSHHQELGSYKLADYDNHYRFTQAEPPSADYHIYAVEWDYREMKFYVDEVLLKLVRWGTDPDGRDYLIWYDGDGRQQGKIYEIDAYDDAGNRVKQKISCQELDFAFCNEENPHFLLMNVTICNWNANQATNGGNLPQSMYVDYVRVYQKAKD